jgi:SAM-dependent methyltransferase
MQKCPDTSIQGIDVLIRPSSKIHVSPFDGVHVPFSDKSFDAVLFVDVLHHVKDPLALLREAARVGRSIVIKDHFRRGILAGTTLRVMDWVGNAHHGVALTYSYWTKSEWLAAFDSVGLRPVETMESLGLYPPPASWLFDRGLHFISRLEHTDAWKGARASGDSC